MINDKTGDIHAMKRLDREEKAEYTLTAQAVDRDTNQPLEPPSEFIIKVQDINDNAPEFVEGPYHATVPEMSVVGTYVCLNSPGSECSQLWPCQEAVELVMNNKVFIMLLAFICIFFKCFLGRSFHLQHNSGIPQ